MVEGDAREEQPRASPRTLAVNDTLMERKDFVIGQEFWCGGKRWRCTDIGSRVIVAICLEPHEIVTSLPGEQPGDPRREVRSRRTVQ